MHLSLHTAVKVRCVSFDIHDAIDSLSDHNASSSIPLSYLIYCSGPCVCHIQVVYKQKSVFQRLKQRNKVHTFRSFS